MTGERFWTSARALLWGLRHCKRNEVLNPDGTVTLDRASHIQLSLDGMRRAIFPYRLYEWTKAPTRRKSWHWRGKTIHTSMQPNPWRCRDTNAQDHHDPPTP